METPETEGPWSPWLDMGSTDRLIAVIDQTGGADMSDHIDRDDLEAEIERLTRERDEARAENERLRAGIKALIVEYDEERDLMEPDYRPGLAMASEDLITLLNPTCCRYCGETGGDCPYPCC